VGLRSANGWLQRRERAESRVWQAARAVPPFEGAICIKAVEFYFVGRVMGWRMFDGLPEDSLHCDVAIFGPLQEGFVAQFQAAGFRRETMLLDAPNAGDPLYGARGFGPFWFYRRVPAQAHTEAREPSP
jgi:hypothetical protein